MLAGANVIKKEARAKSPKDTGALRAGIVVKRVTKADNVAEYLVTVSTREMKKYVAKSRAAILELQGPIASVTINGKTFRAKKLLRQKETYESFGDLYYGRFKEFGTSKMAATPFLRPAFESQKENAVKAIGQKLDERIQKYAHDLARK